MVTTAGLTTVTLVYGCTVTQEPLIRSFFADPEGGAGGGALFDFIQPFTGATVNARFKADNPPSSASAPPKFDVTVVLEVDAW